MQALMHGNLRSFCFHIPQVVVNLTQHLSLRELHEGYFFCKKSVIAVWLNALKGRQLSNKL